MSPPPPGESQTVPIRRVLVWFRHALRIHDNPCLTAALEEQLAAAAAVDGQQVEVQVFPLFIFDGLSGSTQLCGFNRFQFLLECLKDLDQQVNKVAQLLSTTATTSDTALTSYDKRTHPPWLGGVEMPT